MTRYIVKIQIGKGKNLTRTHSTPLSSKAKVRRWIKRNPVGNLRTKVVIKDKFKKTNFTTTKAGGSVWGWKPKFNLK